MHAVQILLRHAFSCEALPHLGNLTLATNHANVARLTVVDLLQDTLIVLMPTRHQHHVIVLPEVKRLPRLVKIHHDGGIRFREALCVGKGRAVVDHFDFETGQFGGAHEEEGDMPTAKNIHGRGGQYRLQKNLQLSAIFRLVGLNGKLLTLQDLLALTLHKGFQRRIAQRADGAAVVTH